MKQVRKNEPENFCTIFKKGSENRSSRFEPKILWISFSRGSGPHLKGIVGDETRLRFWNKHQKIELLLTQLARYNKMHKKVLKYQKTIPEKLANK